MIIPFLDIDYYLTMLPLVAAHLLVPPVTYLTGLESIPHDSPIGPILSAIYNSLPRAFYENRYRIILDLMLRENERGLNHLSSAHLTHIFIHHNFQHLFNNMLAMIMWGYPVYQEFAG